MKSVCPTSARRTSSEPKGTDEGSGRRGPKGSCSTELAAPLIRVKKNITSKKEGKILGNLGKGSGRTSTSGEGEVGVTTSR